MGILIPGMIASLISWMYKLAGIILVLLGILPFLIVCVLSIFHDILDPSGVQQATSAIASSGTNATVGEIEGFAGSVAVGSIIGLIIPNS